MGEYWTIDPAKLPYHKFAVHWYGHTAWRVSPLTTIKFLFSRRCLSVEEARVLARRNDGSFVYSWSNHDIRYCDGIWGYPI